MRVMQVIDSLNVGGAEVLAMNIANELSVMGLESHLCVTRQEGHLKHNINHKVKYVFLGRKRTLDFKSIYRLFNYVRKNKIEVIHAHSSSFFMGFCIKILSPNIKLVWHDHYGDSEFANKRPNRKVIKLASRFFHSIITVNSILKKWSEINLHCKNVFYLNNFYKEYTSSSNCWSFVFKIRRFAHFIIRVRIG